MFDGFMDGLQHCDFPQRDAANSGRTDEHTGRVTGNATAEM
jgi:hypothetical protein